MKIETPVHLHLDIDVIDSSEAPGSNYPVVGGPSVAETVAACSAFSAKNDIVAISISGWTGSLDPNGKTKEACIAVLKALTG